MALPAKVSVTVNGKTYQVEPGLYSLRSFEQAVGLKKTAQLSITTPHPTQATTINGNDSLTILGGEVMTATLGN